MRMPCTGSSSGHSGTRGDDRRAEQQDRAEMNAQSGSLPSRLVSPVSTARSLADSDAMIARWSICSAFIRFSGSSYRES